SAGAMRDSFTFPRASRAYFDRLLPALEALHARGLELVVLGGTVPYEVVPAIFGPTNRYDEVLPLFDGRVRFDEGTGPLYRIDAHGDLVSLRLEVVAGLDLGDPRRAAAVRLIDMERVVDPSATGLCLRSTGAGGAL